MKHVKVEEQLSSQNKKNKAAVVVDGLYKAIARGDTGAAAVHLVRDLEWWFHGPQNCHHMMKMLTGQASGKASFQFNPRSFDAIDDELVIVEGWEGVHAYWVHVWKVNEDGLITQFREYFNTWLTVADLGGRPSTPVKLAAGCPSTTSTLWQSHPRDLAKRSLPGLMLAI